MVCTYSTLYGYEYLKNDVEDEYGECSGCTMEPFGGINVSGDNQGNFYLDQKKSIEGVVKAAKVTGYEVQKLPYPLEGQSPSKADNAKDETEAKEVAKVPYRALIGMLSHIMGHTEPDIAYTLNVLSLSVNQRFQLTC